MSNQDFSDRGYQVIRELGCNLAGGRVTYLASSTESQKQVAIKMFQFASSGASWAAYDAYQREIQVLQGLDCPGIPRYLDSFQTPTGFCLVQEYKEAESLAVARQWQPEQVKQIAISLLEILVYLQNRIPPVIHRDIKPENILVAAREAGENIDNNSGKNPENNPENNQNNNLAENPGNNPENHPDKNRAENPGKHSAKNPAKNPAKIDLYLIDFGFARIGEGEVAASSMVKGTLGFMPPEQLFNRDLNAASDLYGVGATLICLLSGTKSIDIGNLIDSNYRIHFQSLLSKLSQEWIRWLEKMVEPKPKDRFADAAAALEALKPLEILSVPKVKCSPRVVRLKATSLGEQLTATLKIRNPSPGTILSGRLKIAPHPKDPRVKPPGHAWIAPIPTRFKGNKIECKIVVATSKLKAGKTYDRQLLLHSNAAKAPYIIPLKVQTAPLPTERSELPYNWLAILFALIAATVWTDVANQVGGVLAFLNHLNSLFGVFLFILAAVGAWKLLKSEEESAQIGSVAGVKSGAILGAIAGLAVVFYTYYTDPSAIVVAALGGAGFGSSAGALASAGTEVLAWNVMGWAAEEKQKKIAGQLAGALVGIWPLIIRINLINSGMAFAVWLTIVTLASIAAGIVIVEVEAKEFSERCAIAFCALILGLGLTAGGLLQFGWHLWLFLVFLGTSIALARMIYPVWQRKQAIVKYRQSEEKLIEL